MLGERGWRLMCDELALVDLAGGQMFAFPRLISLKNGAISAMRAEADEARFGPLLAATRKGDIRQVGGGGNAVEQMGEGASPAMLLFPRFGFEPATRPVARSECFMRDRKSTRLNSSH